MKNEKKKGWQRMSYQLRRRFERRAWRQYLKTGVRPRNLVGDGA